MNQRKRKLVLYRRSKTSVSRLVWVAPATIQICISGIDEMISALRKMAIAMSALQISVALAGAHKIIKEHEIKQLQLIN